MIRATPLGALVLLTSLVGATALHAEMQTWDQAKVTALAGELAEKTADIRKAVRRAPAPALGQAGRNAHHRLRDELGAIQSTARRLHTALSEGATQEETFPTYRRLIQSVRRAADELPRIQMKEPAAGKIEAAAGILRQLRPFYEEEPPV